MSDLSAEMLRQMLHYDPETGAFTWVKTRCCRIRLGSRAGRVDNKGYRGININGKKYSEHRLAWLYMTGTWPQFQIDHINCDKVDNRFANLRDVTGSENCLNRRPTGRNSVKRAYVSYHRPTGKWQASCWAGVRKVHYVGLFDSRDAALAAAQGVAS